MGSITLEKYISIMGSAPPYNELERCNCDRVGEPGHRYCGWCVGHNKPRAACGCIAAWKEALTESQPHDFRGLRRKK